MTTVFLQIALDVTQERNIGNASGGQQQQRTRANDNGKDEGYDECARYKVRGILRQVIPITSNAIWACVLCQIERNQSHCIDSLPRSVSKQETFPAFEREEDEEGKVVFLLGGVADVAEETEVIIRAQAVVVIGHHVGEGVGDVSAGNDLFCFIPLISQQEKREDDAANE